MASDLHISISAEPIVHIGPLAITNSIFTSLIVSAILIFIAIFANSKLKKSRRPQGLQNFLEMLVEGLYNLTHDITQSSTKTAAIFPVTTTFFLFIVLNNWFGLLPGVGTIGFSHQNQTNHSSTFAPPTYAADIQSPDSNSQQPRVIKDERILGEEYVVEKSPGEIDIIEGENVQEEHQSFTPLFRAGSADINTTLALALFSMIYVQALGFKFLGLSYLTKFFNFKNAIFTFVGLLELVSEFAKIISFTFRLFGNIFAGEVLLVVIGSLLPIAAPVPFYFLEVFVGAVQALVFMMLSIVFMNMATQSHSEDH